MRGEAGPCAQHREHALGSGRESKGARLSERFLGRTLPGEWRTVDDGNPRRLERVGQSAGERQACGTTARDHDVVALAAGAHCPLNGVWPLILWVRAARPAPRRPRTRDAAMQPKTAKSAVAKSGGALADLLSILDLEPLEENLFRGRSPQHGWQRVYGGQVLGQALVATVRTVPPERIAHSLHAYFLLPGNPTRPIIYNVERVRDGGSFTTR